MLTTEQLTALRAIGETFYVDDFAVYRTGIAEQDPSSIEYDPYSDYGDSDLKDPEAVGSPSVTIIRGWLFSKLQNRPDVREGQSGTSDLHEFRAAVGVDVRADDAIRRVGSGLEYIVVDTNADDTWAEQFKATVRRVEVE